MAEREAESEAKTVETGWSVSTSRVLIQFYNENPLLWNTNHRVCEEKYNHEKAEAFVGEARKEQSSSHRGGCEKKPCTGLEAQSFAI